MISVQKVLCLSHALWMGKLNDLNISILGEHVADGIRMCTFCQQSCSVQMTETHNFAFYKDIIRNPETVTFPMQNCDEVSSL